MSQARKLHVIGVQVKVIPEYTCRECGAKGQGSSAHLSGPSYDTAMLGQVTNAHMPVGWASYGSPSGWEYACPEHVR